jgi:hypothetical protein
LLLISLAVGHFESGPTVLVRVAIGIERVERSTSVSRGKF